MPVRSAQADRPVEDRIRCGKPTRFGHFPSRGFGVNAVWLDLSLAAIDLLASIRVLLLDAEPVTVEPKKRRYQLLHVAARLTRGGRRLRLRISATCPWRPKLAAAFHRLAALPLPAEPRAGRGGPARGRYPWSAFLSSWSHRTPEPATQEALHLRNFH